MGHEFLLEKLSAAYPGPYPCEPAELQKDTGNFPWLLLKQHLIELGARQEGSQETLLWDCGEQGQISIEGTDSYVALKVYADWDLIAQVYSWLRKRDPLVILTDPETELCHDPVSFRALVQASQKPE